MAHRFNPKHKSKLDTKERRRDLPPNKVLEKLGLKKNDTVADIGCGIGYFTIPMAKVVTGEVYAVDIAQEMLDEVAAKKEELELNNIKLINSNNDLDNIAQQTVDFMLMSNLVHEVEDKKEFLKNYLTKVKVGGRLAIIDFKKIDSEVGPPLKTKVSKADLYKLLEEIGLTPKLVTSLNSEQYAILAKK